MKSNYIGHDRIYQRLKAEGAYGWTTEDDQTQTVQPRILDAIAHLALLSGSRILDLGCGTGDIAIWLARQGYEAYGIDIAPSAIAWAIEKASSQTAQVQFTVGSVLDLVPYGDSRFHLVVDGRCLHCIIGGDRAAVLSSIYRVLQPGGGFLVQSMCGDVLEKSSIRTNFDADSRCTISPEGFATRYIGVAEDILQELIDAGFAIAHWEIIPRQGSDDQDDLIALATR